MGLTVKPATARRIMDMLNRGNGGGITPITPVLQSYTESRFAEWAQFVYDAQYIRVVYGPVTWAQTEVNAGYKAAAGFSDEDVAYYEVDYSGIATDAIRWLYVETDLNKAGDPDSVTPKFMTDATLPMHDPANLIVRTRLSRWKKTATGITLLPPPAHIGGAIDIVPASFGYPTA